MQGVALGIGGWTRHVEIVPETTYTTNGLATFSGVGEESGGVLELRPRPTFASVDELKCTCLWFRGRESLYPTAFFPRVASFGSTDEPNEPHGSYYRVAGGAGITKIDVR